LARSRARCALTVLARLVLLKQRQPRLRTMAKGKRKKAAAAERKGKRQRLEQQPAPPAPPQQQSPPPNPAAVGDQSAPGPPSHHVQVLTADERLEALLGILNRPADEVLTTVVFAGTKAGCDKLHAALAAQPGSARWALEVVHGNKRRDEQEASLRAFAAGQCRCLVATETVARKLGAQAFADGSEAAGSASVDVLVNYELPEDFFVRPAATHQAFIRRIGRRGCTTFLRTDSFGDTDVKAAHSLVCCMAQLEGLSLSFILDCTMPCLAACLQRAPYTH
jgi:hypothetical protein